MGTMACRLWLEPPRAAHCKYNRSYLPTYVPYLFKSQCNLHLRLLAEVRGACCLLALDSGSVTIPSLISQVRSAPCRKRTMLPNPFIDTLAPAHTIAHQHYSVRTYVRRQAGTSVRYSQAKESRPHHPAQPTPSRGLSTCPLPAAKIPTPPTQVDTCVPRFFFCRWAKLPVPPELQQCTAVPSSVFG
jgi:hypothetical protein